MIPLRECRMEDMDAITYLQPEGWSDIIPFFRFYVRQKFCYPIVACDGDRIVGVANAIVNGASGWLAHIIVGPDMRRSGIGYRLTGHLVDFLSNKGCRSQLLIATQMGEGLYRKFGFETTGEYLFFNEGTVSVKNAEMNIRPMCDSDKEHIFQLDLEISGERRAHMLNQFMHNTYVYESDHKIRGFYLSEFEEGMILAGDDEAGIALMQFKHNSAKRKTVLPAENKKGAEYLISHDFNIVNRAPRMATGEKIPWKPASIFSRAGGFYG